MLYSPQNALVSGHFVRLIGIISGIHIAVLLALFVSEYLFQGRPLVMSMGMARVQMQPGRSSGGKGGGSRGPAPASEQSASSNQQPSAESNKAPRAPLAEKKATPMVKEAHKEVSRQGS